MVWVVVGAVHTAYVFQVMHTGSENKGALVYLISVGFVTVIAALIAGKIGSAAVMSFVEEMIYDSLGSFGSMFDY